MWIRSQYGTSLIKAEEIFIVEYVDEYKIHINNNVVATYSTEYQALEVLYEIQKRLEETYDEPLVYLLPKDHGEY